MGKQKQTSAASPAARDRGAVRTGHPGFPEVLKPFSGASPQPLYIRIKRYIYEKIDNGHWLPGTRIPSENELVEIFGVSRMTINRALKELTGEGLLNRLQGVGTFVAVPKPQIALLEVRSISDEIAEWGGRHNSLVHHLAEEEANPDLAGAMGLETGARVFHSILVHRDGEDPVQISDRYVNPAAAPDYLDQDFTRITPNQYLMEVAPLQQAEHVLEAIRPDGTMQRLLAIDPDEPCLLLHRRTWSFGLVATKNRFVYPGSRYRLGGRFTPHPW